MKKSALAALSALVLAGAITSVILQYRTIENLRAENFRARELLQKRADESSLLNQTQTDVAELERLRREHLELLRLRDETGALCQQLQRATNLLARQTGAPPQPGNTQPDPEDASPVVIYQAKIETHIPAQRSLLT